jgi:thiamine biosynthesis protein ThiS
MNVVVNGKPRDVDTGATIADLVEVLGLRSRNVVVERTQDDVLEIVRPVQGG